MRTFLALIALLLATAAHAQTPPSPAQMGITATTPQSLQTLDSSKTWAPLGTVDPTNHAFTGYGAATDVRAFGAKCDGSTDDKDAINAALAAVKAVYLPSTLPCVVSGTINVTQDGAALVGAGMGASVLISANPNLPAIKIAGGLNQVTLQGFTVDRSVSATSGGDGVDFSAGNIHAHIVQVQSRNHWHGFNLGGTANGQIINSRADTNYSDGFYLTNSTANPAGQWSFVNSASVLNDGWGVNVVASPSTTMTMLPWYGMQVFANTLGGANFQGSSTGHTADIQICGGDYSSNGNHNLQFDFVLSTLSIDCGTFIEQAGQTTTGRGNITPASNVGRGINVTGAVGNISVGNATIFANSQAGMVSGAFRTQVVGATFLQNGMAAPGTYDGLSIQNTTAGSTALVSGVTSGNLNSGTTVQAYGVTVQSGVGATVTGNDLCFNTVKALRVPTSTTSASVYGNVCAIYNQSGIGNIAASATSAVITHSLQQTPTQVLVAANSTPTTPANVVGVWADTFTATTFTVHLTAATTGGVNFSWTARVFNN